MIASEVITLLNMLRGLAQRKTEIDKAYFDNFIQPVWDIFYKIHQDYKASFKRYTDLTYIENQTPESLLEIMHTDSVYTHDMRSELKKMIEHLPSVGLKARENLLKNFVKSISDYFFLDEALDMKFLNLRYSAIDALRSNNGKISSREIANYFLRMVHVIQAHYEIVVGAYQSLKKELYS